MAGRFRLSPRAGNRGAVVNAARAVAAGREAERAVDGLVVRLRAARANAVLRRLERAGVAAMPVHPADGEAGAANEHLVGFYPDDEALVGSVASFLLPAVLVGAPAVVVATEDHRAGILASLRTAGADVEGALRSGSLRCTDAAATMAGFLVDDSPHPTRFDAVVGGLLSEIAPDGEHVRVYGEMVALLWDEGNVQAAIELEELWNGLAGTRRFSLYCGYPVAILDGDAGANPIRTMCQHHSGLVLEPSDSVQPRQP